MRVQPAMYGYISVVTSSPRARASRKICSICGARFRELELMWTTCSGAPVTAAAEIASSSPASGSESRPGGSAPQMYVAGRAILCRQPEHLEDLPTARGRRIDHSEARGHRALPEAHVHQALHLFNLSGRGRLVCAGARRQKITGVLHHFHANLYVADRDAVVDRRFSLARRIPGRHISRPDFEFEAAGDAVARLECIGLEVLPMLVQVDESRRHHQAACIDDSAALQRQRAKSLRCFRRGCPPSAQRRARSPDRSLSRSR